MQHSNGRSPVYPVRRTNHSAIATGYETTALKVPSFHNSCLEIKSTSLFRTCKNSMARGIQPFFACHISPRLQIIHDYIIYVEVKESHNLLQVISLQRRKTLSKELLRARRMTEYFTSNYRQTWYPHSGMNIIVSSIVEMSLNKIALWIGVGADDLTAVRAITASNELYSKIQTI